LSDRDEHATHVEAWMQAAAKGLAADQLPQLFERALDVLWQRAHGTLGDVTLVVIVDRVLHGTVERSPMLAALKVDASGFHCDELREHARSPVAFAQGMKLFMVEFLTVVGSLTAEILTPALHSALSGVMVLPESRESRGGPRGKLPAKIGLDEGRSR
jgi:hypothetical protein